jgi:pimeloyl-ACP methyl ester carboxylesterase
MDCAQKIILFIEQNCGGKVLALCGLSIGAQITVEILSQRPDITLKAVIESALVLPMKMGQLVPIISTSYPLLRFRWFARLQAKQMYLPNEMFDSYFSDSQKMTKRSLINMTVSNAEYTLPETFANTTAEIAVLCGEQELKMMKRSAQLIYNSAPSAILRVVPQCGHGVSVKYPKRYTAFLKLVLENKMDTLSIEQLL